MQYLHHHQPSTESLSVFVGKESSAFARISHLPLNVASASTAWGEGEDRETYWQMALQHL